MRRTILFFSLMVAVTIMISSFSTSNYLEATNERGFWGQVKQSNGTPAIIGTTVKAKHLTSSFQLTGAVDYWNGPGTYRLEIVLEETDLPTGQYQITALDNSGHVGFVYVTYPGNAFVRCPTITLSAESIY